MHFRNVSERAKLSHPLGREAVLAALVAGAVAVAACDERRGAPTACYDLVTRKLVRLDLDANGDGYVEQRTYLDGNVPYRTEIDADGDGRIDRWEYVDSHARVIRVGSSSRSDGIEDQWVYPPDAVGEQRVDRSSERSARADRREFFRGTTLVRAEEDTDEDGAVDQWEIFDGGVLRQIAYDTTHARGRADRRLVYDERGRFVRLEVDGDGDGEFAASATER